MSKDLETLAAKMELSPLMRTNGGLTLSHEAKEARAGLRQVVVDNIVANAKVSSLTQVTKHAMEGADSVDALRNELAGGDPIKNSVLATLESKYVRGVGKIIDGMTDPFGI